jgi:selenide,water dikinase
MNTAKHNYQGKFMQSDQPLVKDIILVGGGHSHALVIRMWAMNPVPGIRITLISPAIYTPYSGMLPGLLAGHYCFDETHIDLSQLCAWAGVRFIQDKVTNISGLNKKLCFNNRPDIEYDVCSIDIGSSPSQSITGSEEFAIGVKPIAEFHQHWLTLQQQLLQHSKQAEPLKIAIIGAGAGGIELITAMKFWADKHQCNGHFHLINRSEELFPNAEKGFKKKLNRQLKSFDILVTDNFSATKIDADKIYGHDTNCQDTNSQDLSIAYDKVFYCTQAVPPAWLKKTDLDLSQAGFISVNTHLQSPSHPEIFAAGDVSHFTQSPLPKAGVFAVRMAPILLKNLIDFTLQKPLTVFKPQRHFLSLIALGDQYALGSRRPFNISGAWVWKLKNHIDKKFMNLFHQLPDMSHMNGGNSIDKASKKPLHNAFKMLLNNENKLAFNPRCGGCGGKISADILTSVIDSLKPYSQAGVTKGLKSKDDAAVFTVPDNSQVVQSLDHIKTCISDPYLFAQISALHALSDLFAMNAQPHSALALVQLPNALAPIQRRDMQQIMQGALAVLNQHKCELTGGHSSENSDLQLGFCVNGIIENTSNNISSPASGAQLGHVIIMTKALGTGVILAAHMQGKAKGEYTEAAINSMLQSNATAAKIFKQYNLGSLTDVTGFGLTGHLLEVIRNCNQTNNQVVIAAQISLEQLPALDGSLALFEQGFSSTLQQKNQLAEAFIGNANQYKDNLVYPLLFDPQTSGGLLATLPADQAQACLQELVKAGMQDAAIIARIVEPLGDELVRLV